MPLLLKIFFVISIFGLFIAVFSILPVGQYNIDGKEVTYHEWWSSGTGLNSTIMGTVLFVSGIGIFKKKNWAKYTFLSTLFISFAENPSLTQKEMIYAAMFWFIFLGWYLFIKQSVKEYFQ